MAKWADYLISCVTMNARGTHIDSVGVRLDNGDSVGAASTWTRAQVVAAIERGTTFCTIFWRDGQWYQGAAVEVVIINGQKFLRTDRDAITADNLDELPACP